MNKIKIDYYKIRYSLKCARIMGDFTLRKLSEISKIRKIDILLIESGIIKPNLYTLVSIGKALGVGFDNLIYIKK